MNNQKLKILPGRALSGRDIQKRLKNRTLVGETYDKSDYNLDEEMTKFVNMNQVERVAAIKENNKKIQEISNQLQETENRKKAALEEKRINDLAEQRLKELREQQSNPKSND